MKNKYLISGKQNIYVSKAIAKAIAGFLIKRYSNRDERRFLN